MLIIKIYLNFQNMEHMKDLKQMLKEKIKIMNYLKKLTIILSVNHVNIVKIHHKKMMKVQEVLIVLIHLLVIFWVMLHHVVKHVII